MLVELAVSNLGVIDELGLVLGPGMTALTGETGTGKTILVSAIELLVGGRADGALVRPGTPEAVVEGRFVEGEEERVLCRVVPGEGRSRAYVDGRLAPVGALAEYGAGLVDLHGQHAHQSLLSPATQRAALDAFAGVDLRELRACRARLAEIDAALAAHGGDERARAREIDLLRFQLAEIDDAGLDGADEEERLEAEEDRLADASAHREAGEVAHRAIADDGGALDSLGAALDAVGGRAPFAEVERRLRGLHAELADVGSEARAVAEGIDEDPERLAAVRDRRQLLTGLRRKYGATLADVLGFAEEARERLRELEQHDERVAELEREREHARGAEAAAAAEVARARRAGAPQLADAVTAHLRALAMPRAEVAVTVGAPDPGDAVDFLLAANAGEPALPLAKVASGGELARSMLALRLALGHGAAAEGGPTTLVFDEVDAGIGGEAAVAVGRALASLAAERQVLVVTHLPQVAAFADAQVAVEKHERDGRTVAQARALDGDERVVELSRMLAGRPGSDAAREHALELLASAAAERGR